VIPLLRSEDIVYLLGAGPNYGTAHYGAAKLLEAVGVSGVAVQLEEWAHAQFHISGTDTTYIVLSPLGSGHNRVLEQLDGLRDMEANLVVVAQDGDTNLGARALRVIPVSGRLPEEFSPLETCVPLQLLAVELAMARDVAMRMRIDEHKRDVNFRQIFHSSIRVPSEHSVSNLNTIDKED
jgi:glucosamine--fructose-6-phosphate aminotransferase (isomerizing)